VAQLHRVEEYIIAHPIIVPFLEKHFLTPEVYVGLYGLMALFLVTHMLNIDNSSYVITGMSHVHSNFFFFFLSFS
jgi:hypothetical protein